MLRSNLGRFCSEIKDSWAKRINGKSEKNYEIFSNGMAN